MQDFHIYKKTQKKPNQTQKQMCIAMKQNLENDRFST